MAFKGNNIPQAFTGKDVSEAFLWLQSQPEPIRKHVKSTDELMPLYFRYKRTGTLALFETANTQGQLTFQDQNQNPSESKFSDTLKNLRKEIDTFGGNEPVQTSTVVSAPTNVSVSAAGQQSGAHQSSATPRSQAESFAAPASHNESLADHSSPMNLDIKSLEIVETIRRGLNLSSQEEVIRMCLVLGFEKLKSILP